ncbi:MAG: hypothetical protein HYZ75_16035 [Elusimicrobia bacterium]|nr:hypothetical protein [Elusimicrobiota bacterium]
MLTQRLEAVLGPERAARLRARLEEVRPHLERAQRTARELPPRDWAGLAVAAMAFLFVLQFSRLLTRQTRLLERQTDLLAAAQEAAAAERDTGRMVARARLRAALWRVQTLLRPAALKEASLLPPDRRGASVREARQVLEEEEFSPALAEDPESSRAWESALSAARLAEETAAQPETDAQFFLMQAERVRRDVLTVRDRLAPLGSSEVPSASMAPSPAPVAPVAPQPPPESSPLPKPTDGMAK